MCCYVIQICRILTHVTLAGIVAKDNTCESHMPNPTSALSDDLVQMGRPAKIEGRHVNMPLELGSTMVFDTLAAFETARDARYETGTLFYGRYSNATTAKLEKMLAQLEHAAGVTLTSSGVAAITMTLLTFARPGAHLLVADHVYRNTRAFCDDVLVRIGVEIEYFDPIIGTCIADLLRDKTCAVMFEAPGSGTFEVPDIPAIAQAARAAGVPSILDGTWGDADFLPTAYSGCRCGCGLTLQIPQRAF